MLVPATFPITCHTDRVGIGSTFVAIPGTHEDGSRYIPLAIERGATTIVLTSEAFARLGEREKASAEFVIVDDPRIALAELSAKAHGHPANQLSLIGVTGTAGKTTTAHLIHHILSASGCNAALLSGVVNRIGNQEEPSTRTTPPADYLQAFFASCVRHGVTHVVMEVSSHALAQHRVHGLEFNVAIFTNLSPEHLDYHTDLTEYAAVKSQLFNQLKEGGLAIANADDEWTPMVVGNRSATLVGRDAGTHRFEIVEGDFWSGVHCSLEIGGKQASFVAPALLGTFNAYNLAMAAHAAAHCGITVKDISSAVFSFGGVSGRMQVYRLE